MGTLSSPRPGVTGNVAIVSDGCDPAVRNGHRRLRTVRHPAGTIALVDRGLCNFTVKAKNAQNEGAIAIIVVQNTGGSPPSWAAQTTP